MQRKIFKVMTLLVCCTLLIFLIIAGSISHSYYRSSAMSEIKSIAEVAVKEDLPPQEIGDLVDGVVDFDIRVTFIAEDGTVEYDSVADASQMENHSNRKEFREAMKSGRGEAVRQSETLDYSTYYYAIRYQDGVIRFAADRSNLAGLFLTVFPIFVVVAGAILLVTTIISIKLSESLIKPINTLVKQLDLRNENIGAMETPYEELEPIIKNADVLMSRIRRNVEKIRQEKEKISIITANMVEGMILLDSEMMVLSVNKSALNILQSDYDPASKQNVSALTDNEQLMELFDTARESGSAVDTLLIHGRYYTVFVNKADSESGEYDMGMIAFLLDVTESVQNEQIRRDFSANVSHELKTPLTTIKGFGEMLDNGIFSKPEDVKKYGGMIYRESERLLSLINDIIKLSEIEDGDEMLEEQINLKQVAKDTEEILQNKADEHDITMHVSGENVIVKGSKSYISEVFLNLMDNAVKYNNPGGNLWVELSYAGSLAKIVFRDDGIGISEENRTRVFERFYRVDKSRSKRTGGTGLGLSIVKHIVACHGGEITLKSEVGKGTEITVMLPVQRSSNNNANNDNNDNK